ncbi:MAG: hypothetical protein Q8M76_15390, partial [Spirochaetaceae bacterium]|nr:hypothetical protein [Spirochaetaceae bacterium]
GDSFPSTNFWLGGEAWFTSPMGENASFRMSLERDQVLRNCLLGAIGFERGVARISVGPMIGFLNSSAAPLSMGLSAAVRLQWPGVGYFSMRSDGGFAISILQSGADPQARTELAAGLYVPHAILSGLISAKRFNELDDNGDLVTDMSTRYAVTIDVFKKNIPYTALASVGYELRSKRYEGPDVIDSLGAVTLGLRSIAQLTQAISIEGDINSGVYVFGLDELKGRGPPNNSLLFSTSLGISIDLDCLPPKREKAPIIESEVAAPATEPSTEPSGDGATTTDAAATAPATEAAAIETAPAEAAPEAEPAPPEKRLSFEVGLGAGYKIASMPESDSVILGALSNARLGAMVGFGYKLLPSISIGAELGASYMASFASGELVNLVDAPFHATATWSLGVLRLQGFAGALGSTSIGGSDSFAIAIAPEAGARISVAGFYAESAFVIGLGGAESYPRVGAGYMFRF